MTLQTTWLHFPAICARAEEILTLVHMRRISQKVTSSHVSMLNIYCRCIKGHKSATKVFCFHLRKCPKFDAAGIFS